MRLKMKDWLVNLIVGLASAVLGFIGVFFTKTYSIKSKQKIGENYEKKN